MTSPAQNPAGPEPPLPGTQVSYAAFVGIDWADEEHAVVLIDAASGRSEERSLDQQPAALSEWADELRRRFGGRLVAVCLEQSRGALVYALMKYEFLVLFPVNPKQLARYREAFYPSGGKDDPTDAALLVEFLHKNQGRLRGWRPDDVETRSLRGLCEDRRKLVDQRTALGQQLRQRLKETFPLALDLLGQQPLHADWFLRMLAKCPTFTDLRRASPKTLERLLPNRTRPVTVDDDAPHPRIQLIRAAQPLVTDQAVILAGRMLVESLVPTLVALGKGIKAYEAEIDRLLVRHPDAALFQSLPGAGPALAPRLIAAFGTDRDKFSEAAEVQQMSGIAPVTRQSGKAKFVSRRYACPKFLRQTFHEFADHSRKKSAWAKACYQHLRSKGMGHHAALRSLAYKWIRIIFRCWKTSQPYDEPRYLQSLRKSGAPYIAQLCQTAKA
jgi:transposase